MTFELLTADGERLEARWDAPDDPVGTVILCHALPIEGGTMTSPLLRTITKVLTEHGLAVLRFNFRGVGASTGSWSEGMDELKDVAAAVEAARAGYQDLETRLTGWSFGAVMALRWSAQTKESLRYAGIAPVVESEHTPALPGLSELPEAPRLFVLGDRDQFTEAAELRAYAEEVGGEFELLEGSDHFFYHRERRVGELVAGFLAGPG